MVIKEGKPVVWLFLYIRYLRKRGGLSSAVPGRRSMGGGGDAEPPHLPRVLGFVSADYRKQTVVLQKITNCRITAKQNHAWVSTGRSAAGRSTDHIPHKQTAKRLWDRPPAP